VKDDRNYLKHILECIAAIDGYVHDRGSAALADRMTQKAVLRELQELAESTQRLAPALKGRRPEIPWSDIAGFRNVLVHDYLGLSMPRIWAVIETGLPPLEEAAAALLAQLEKPCDPG
jgi:uncharacterized protein with HEPN domain